MMKLATGKQMKAIDDIAINEFKIPSIVLMENAAISSVNIIKAEIPDILTKSIVIVAGKGNNGGDGFAIARHLFQLNLNLKVIFVGDIKSATADTLINLNIVKQLGIEILEIKAENQLNKVQELLKASDIIIDALLGTGIVGATRGLPKEIIDLINSTPKYKIAIDIPSGINSDNGHVDGNAVKADITITFSLIKQGLLLYPATEYVGKLRLADICIPQKAISKLDIKANLIQAKDLDYLIPKRKSRTNKGSYGKLLIIGGCREMTGALSLCAKAAYKMGAGLVTLASTNEAINVAQHNLLESVSIILNSENGKLCFKSFEDLKYKLNSFDALVLGPGLGQSKEVFKFVEEILYNSTIPLVLDADGLNAVSKDINILKTTKSQIVITPHPGEMSRLTGIPISDILNNTVEIACEFAKEYKVITLLKDCHTIISNPNGEFYINITGSPAMAKAGSGDVLSGIIGSLLAQNQINPFIATALGAYIHGKAGEKAAQKLGINSVLASDLCEFLA